MQVEDSHREAVVNRCRSKREVVVVRGCLRNSRLNRRLSRHVVDRGVVSEGGNSKEHVDMLLRGVYYPGVNKCDECFVRRGESPRDGYAKLAYVFTELMKSVSIIVIDIAVPVRYICS